MMPEVHFGLHDMQHVSSKIDCSWQFIVFPAEISYSYLNPSLLFLVAPL